MNESMYNVHTLYKHTTRIDAKELKEGKKTHVREPGNYKCALI